MKAFNTIGAEHFRAPHLLAGAAFLPIAGDDEGCAVVVPMAAALGFDVHVVGGRDRFDLVEAHARLWIQMAFNGGLGRRWGFVRSES